MAPTDTFTAKDRLHMARCLQLAQRGITSPNPKVGCVIVDKRGRVVGEGYHSHAGQPHAEVVALQQAGKQAAGGTAYVNLEPCNHHGRTPPCTHALKSAGIAHVICGTLDPNPKVSGSGRNALQNARITVREGLLANECEALNRPFFHAMRTVQPYVLLKLALTLDGKLASRKGLFTSHAEPITNHLSQQYVHQLRHHHDAILSTAKTILADNAQLSVRHVPGQPHRQPVRVILDGQQRLAKTPGLALWQGNENTPIWQVVSKHHQDNNPSNDIIPVADTGTGLHLPSVLKELGKRDITTVMIEAGGTLAASFLQAGLVNELVTIHANSLALDAAAPTLSGVTNNSKTFQSWQQTRQLSLGKDLVTHWHPN